MPLDFCGLADLVWRDGSSEWIFAPIVVQAAGAGKGLGVFAARDLLPGERLISELPLVHWENPRAVGNSFDKLEHSFNALDPVRRAAFWAFGQSADVYGEKTSFKGTWLTNALPIVYDGQPAAQAQSAVDGSSGEAGVFATVSRLNHACSPSAHYCWNSKLGQMTVHVLRAVPRGEEITISYLAASGRVRGERQRLLQRDFGFTCACSRCALSGGALARSETLQRAIGDLAPDSDPRSGEMLATSRFGAAPDALIRMLAEEGLPMIWARTTLNSAMAQSNQPSYWAAQLAECLRLAMGADHPSVEELETLRKLRQAMGSAALDETVTRLRQRPQRGVRS